METKLTPEMEQRFIDLHRPISSGKIKGAKIMHIGKYACDDATGKIFRIVTLKILKPYLLKASDAAFNAGIAPDCIVNFVGLVTVKVYSDVEFDKTTLFNVDICNRGDIDGFEIVKPISNFAMR